MSSEFHLPDEEQWEDDDDTNDDGSDGFSGGPRGTYTAVEGEREEDHDEGSSDEDDTYQVELPEDVGPQGRFEDGSDGRWDVIQETHSGCTSTGKPERQEKRDGQSWEDDTPHSDTPSPSWSSYDCCRDVGCDPGVDEIWSGRDEREEESGLKSSRVGHEDLHQDWG